MKVQEHEFHDITEDLHTEIPLLVYILFVQININIKKCLHNILSPSHFIMFGRLLVLHHLMITFPLLLNLEEVIPSNYIQ